jgi:hypothetical protein
MDGCGEEVSAFGRLGAVGVGDAFGCEPDFAGADAMLLVLDDEAELAFEDVEDLVFCVVDVQWGGIAERDAMFENGDAVLAIGLGDANGDGGAEEPEVIGVHGRGGWRRALFFEYLVVAGVVSSLVSSGDVFAGSCLSRLP